MAEVAEIQIPGTEMKVPRRTALIGVGLAVVLILVLLTRGGQKQAQQEINPYAEPDPEISFMAAAGATDSTPAPSPVANTPAAKPAKRVSQFAKDTKEWLQEQIDSRSRANEDYRKRLPDLRAKLNDPTLDGWTKEKARRGIEMLEKQIPRNEMFIATFRDRLARGAYMPSATGGSLPL